MKAYIDVCSIVFLPFEIVMHRHRICFIGIYAVLTIHIDNEYVFEKS